MNLVWFQLIPVVFAADFFQTFAVDFWNPSVSSNDVAYYLYTRKRSSEPLRLAPDNLNQINPNKSTKFIVHGFFENSGRMWYRNMTNEYLRKGDYNVVQVDWSRPASNVYTASASSTKGVGTILGRLIINLHQNFGLPLNNVHIIGHSLGAHVSGYAGKEVTKTTGSLVGRITALDAAGPMFEEPLVLLRGLTKTDAQLVDAIHTDGGVFGRMYRTGTVDFYPNGGVPVQPGCSLKSISFPPTNLVRMSEEVFCSHTKSYYYFISSINSERFLAVRCGSWEEFKQNKCLENTNVVMGDDYSGAPGSTGMFFLRTNAQPPFANSL